MLFENNGDSYCCILNHNGVCKTLEDGEYIKTEATIKVNVKMKDTSILEVFNLCENEYTLSDGNVLNTTLTGGSFILFRFG